MNDKRPHPSGDPVPGKFFAFATVVTTVVYHTLCLDAADEEEAELRACELFHNYQNGIAEHPPVGPMAISSETSVRIKPMRQCHVDRRRR
jgi:hypothetical protein